MKPLLAYDQVRLYPNKAVVHSRSECSTGVELGGWIFKVPVLPANMKCTIDRTLAHRLSENGYFYIMHRFDNTQSFVRSANDENWRLISISIGVKEADRKLIDDIVANKWRVDFITIDVAHGYSVGVEEMLSYLKTKLPSTFRIAGNICDRSAALFLQSWGAQAIKAGIAQGAACTTHGKTGFGLPMFSCIRDICFYAVEETENSFEYRSNLEVPIIADGGFRTNGDFTKALVAGATMCMAGSMFAALSDSPAETFFLYDSHTGVEEECDVIRTTQYPISKKYYGSASINNIGYQRHIEGTMIELPFDKRTYKEKLAEIEADLQSAISYAGGNNIKAFTKVRYGYTH